ncbi:efflux RND transporter permease subunit [Candidatus Uabimicrobium amorphum]|uniref:Multidrug transporter AcrB n=1 Tax=Uabimicrobium amorphum TaxID=2596890 RepID=A0A5S9IKM4_UABAM|nr:efflux RND transporter permease subunit [Candidatus Uabimicrobium amorphum]BBM83290.1 multidrug transporter AcrB [Candidatus Uabimicrobium amorphum]
MKNLLAFFAKRHLLVNLLMAVVIVFGFLATTNMKLEVFPKFDLGIVTITTARPGAGPEDVELSLTVPIEEEILKIDGLKKVVSNSMEGISVITVRLDPDVKNQKQLVNDIQKAVDRAASLLPSDIPNKPIVEEISSLKVPVIELHISGKVPEQLLRLTAKKLADSLREVPGVSGVKKIGFRDREVRILLDPGRLEHLGITYDEIITAVNKRNVRDAGGSVESFVAEKKVLTVGQFSQPKEVENVIIRAAEPGNYIRVRDIAQVVLDYEDWKVQSRINNVMGIALSVRKKANADAVKTTAAVKNFIKNVQSSFPPGVEVVAVNDVSRFTLMMIDVLIGNALIGLILVFVTLVLFFRIRLAFWVSVGLLVSICFTFAMMPILGIGIDMLSLMALILMIGMLVDDAIVTGESIYRHREKGELPLEASVNGTHSVAAPVIVSTLTTILAFTPVSFLGGLEGKFMWTLPVMVALILGASLFECKFMLPAHLMGGKGDFTARKWFATCQNFYHSFILKLVRWRCLTLLVILSVFIGILFLAGSIKFNLYPEVDIDTFFAKVELPEGSSFHHTQVMTAKLEKMIRKITPQQDLLSITSQIGHHNTNVYGITEGFNPAWSLIAIYMKPQGERSTNSNDIIAQLRNHVQNLPGYNSIAFEPLEEAPVPGAPVQLEIIGNDPTRFELGKILYDFLQQQSGVVSVNSSYKSGKDVIELLFDHSLMASRNIAVADVTRAVRIAFDGLIINELQTIDEKIKYRLQFDNQQQGKLATLKNLVIINRLQQKIPLKSFTNFHLRTGEAAIQHYFGQRNITISADIDRFQISVGEINAKVAKFLKQQKLLQRFSKLRIWYGGEIEQQQEALGNYLVAFCICSVGIFFILALLFNSMSQPFLILLVIPFGIAGVILTFILHGLPLSLIALIGVLGLIGVLVNDSLVMIVTLNREVYQTKLYTDESIAQGASERLRPITITSLTSVSGLLPAAYGVAGSNPLITPMILAMAWGILFGTVATLIVLPCIYAVDRDIKRLFGVIKCEEV